MTTLVLLPGLDGTGLLFAPLLKALPPYLQSIVLTYPPDQELGYEELLALVLRALPAQAPFVLLGESFGGPLALRVAATHPPGLRGLILCASFVSYPHSYVPRWSAPLVRAWPFRLFPLISQLKALLGRYSTPALRALTQSALALVEASVLAQRTRAVIQVDVSAELKACTLPMLYLQGQHDLVVPGANLRRIHAIKPDVQVKQLPAPHMLLQTQPELAAVAISSFIEKQLA